MLHISRLLESTPGLYLCERFLINNRLSHSIKNEEKLMLADKYGLLELKVTLAQQSD